GRPRGGADGAVRPRDRRALHGAVPAPAGADPGRGRQRQPLRPPDGGGGEPPRDLRRAGRADARLAGTGPGRAMSDDELRRVIDELASVPVEQLLVGTIQTLANVAFLRLGVVEGAEDAADPSQARLAIDAIASLEPVLSERLPSDAGDELRQMLASLQMAFVGAMSATRRRCIGA